MKYFLVGVGCIAIGTLVVRGALLSSATIGGLVLQFGGCLILAASARKGN